MGISGLLQFLKDASEPINVKKYKGQTVAVDTYCWLHKGAFSCADKLAKGEPTDQYVRYCMAFVEMLLTYGVKPVLVFDGRNLPSKQEVEKARRERREANLQKGRQLLREGKLSAARDCFNKCVNITPGMAHNLIKAARARGVDCVVAPYEADAQLAFLSKSGLAEAVITEDSDLLAFGCKKVILKMDKQGNGLEIDQSNLGRCRNLGDVFTEEKFRYMCILSGCDYLASLYGIGLGKACKLLRIARDPDILKVIRKMGQYLKMDIVVPEHYIEGFTRANNTFLYQLVFDPVKRKVVPLNPYPENIDQTTLSYAGFNVGDDKGLQMALGNIDINTLERIDDFNPDKPNLQYRSRGWSDPPTATGRSIWCTGSVSASTVQHTSPQSKHRPAATRGRERVISLDGLNLPCRELQVKRPREESSISDKDVLQQYSPVTSVKRSRPDQQPGRTQTTRTRNCFATLLQRRNQEAQEEDDGQLVCSRFFSRSSSSASLSTSTKESAREDILQNLEHVDGSPCKDEDKDMNLPSIQATDSDGPEPLSFDTPSPPRASSSTSPSSACHRLRLFHSSGARASTEPLQPQLTTSGLTALHQFQYKKDTSSSSPKVQRLTSQASINEHPEDSVSSSPPSQDSAYFSQSQPDDTFSEKEVYSSCQELITFDTCTQVNNKSPPHPKKRSVSLGSKVSGLSKVKHESHSRTAKSPVLGPARVSGLRKKSLGSGKKLSSSNNENSPTVQMTISNLWKNFSYKKDNLKMMSCREGESKPLSPVKDNMQPSTTTDKKLISSCGRML